MLDMQLTVPEKTKIKYHLSENSYEITQNVPASIYEYDHEAIIELADKNHLKIIKRARLDYKQGKVISEKELMKKLR